MFHTGDPFTLVDRFVSCYLFCLADLLVNVELYLEGSIPGITFDRFICVHGKGFSLVHKYAERV